MQYRTDTKSGNKLSALGFGCMRLPRGVSARIDVNKTEQLVMSAIENGVNYFDTAYLYFGSEQALGEVFKRNAGVREKIFLATKLPHFQCKTYEDFDRIFETQLKRLNTGYIDYYLIHNVGSLTPWEKLCKLGIEKWIAEKKASGSIRQIGFSFHGLQSAFMTLLEAYDWDFCQIQYNYMNENYQAGTKGLKKAHEKGMAVIVMEPLLGGKLATGLPKAAAEALKAADSGLTPAAWALRWLWNSEEVTVVLSGMNAAEQVNENIKTARNAKAGMLNEAELQTIERVVSIFNGAYKIPCTGCNYCLPCPKGVNIPGCFAGYNTSYVSGFVAGISQYMNSASIITPKTYSGGRACVQCGQCEKKCPQHIEIPKLLPKVSRRMEPFWVRGAVRLVMGSRKDSG